MKKTRSILLMLTVIALIAVALVLAGCSSAIKPSQADNQNTQSSDNNVPATPEKTISASEIVINTTKPAEVQQQETAAQVIADGTYTDQVEYHSPGGQDTIEISLTVEKDIVKAVSIKSIKADGTSIRFINGVNDALPDLVIGKKISELNLPKQISGSSLTTTAFKFHVDQLIGQN